MVRFVRYVLIFALMANQPVLSDALDAVSHVHDEKAGHHGIGHDFVGAPHQNSRDIAVTDATSDISDETFAVDQASAKHSNIPCCTLIGGMCVALIVEALCLSKSHAQSKFHALILRVLAGVQPEPTFPPPRTVSHF